MGGQTYPYQVSKLSYNTDGQDAERLAVNQQPELLMLAASASIDSP